MKNRIMEYPHPVLLPNGNDFIESKFDITYKSDSDEDKTINITFDCNVECEGLLTLLSEGKLKMIMKVNCKRTSYRQAERLLNYSNAVIEIPKDKVSDTVFLQALIVAAENNVSYKLKEFNPIYFKDQSFLLRKGDIVAISSEIIVKLDTILEKNIPSIVLVSSEKGLKELKVVYSKTDEKEEKFRDYITILLPEEEYLIYEELRKKKSFKSGVSRFLQASLIVPALTEGISKLRMEDCEEPEEGEGTYHNTVWADSICDALKERFEIDDLSECPDSDYRLANRLLGNVEGDSLNNLIQKMKDWSMLHQEDDIL